MHKAMCAFRFFLGLVTLLPLVGRVDSAGRLYCGPGPAADFFGINSYRQLGLGDQFPRYTPATLPWPDNTPILCAALGLYHTFIKTQAGNWWAFGRNDNGQLGLNTDRTIYDPALLGSMGGQKIVSLSPGQFHSCFLLANGQVYCTGLGQNGQLGRGVLLNSYNVTPAAAILPASITVTSVIASYYGSAVLTNTGLCWSWGANAQGQLGVGVSGPFGPIVTPVQTLIANATICAMASYVSGWVTADGKGYFAGTNQFGQMADTQCTYDSAGRCSTPAPIVPLNGRPVTNIAVAAEHSALGTDAGWYFFGHNTYGQIGIGDASISIVSTQFFLVPPDGNRITRVALGAYHTLIGTAGANFYAFGYNYDGELGIGNTDNQFTPQLLTIREQVISVIAGGYHSAVMRAATYTPTMTMTITAATCTYSAASFASAAVTVSGVGSCTFELNGGAGSSSWFTQYVALTVTSLAGSGALAIQLLSGCSQNSSGTCEFSYGKLDVGRQQLIEVGAVATPSTSGLRVAAIGDKVHISGAYTFDARNPGFQAQLESAYQGTALLLGLTCGLTALAALLLCGLAACVQDHRGDKVRLDDWAANTRKRGWAIWLLAFGAFCFLAGLSWLIIAALCAHPLSLLVGLLAAGAALAALGLLLATACVLWMLRDPVKSECPECHMPVSRWRFRGTYLPPDGESELRFRKAHTRHVRCLVCTKPVVTDRWAPSPPMRPYHTACWDDHCSKAVADQDHFTSWWNVQGAHVTNEELVHLLAAAAEAGSLDGVKRLLAVDPRLPGLPVSTLHGRTALHIAARAGALPILTELLRTKPYVLDPVCPVDPEAAQSLSIKGAEKEENDLYVYQPLLLYNDFPFFVGLTKGKYIYYYKPRSDGKKAYMEGWCLSAHLGSGRPGYRLPIAEVMNRHHIPSGEADLPASRVHSPVRRALKKVNAWLQHRSARPGSGSGSGSARGANHPTNGNGNGDAPADMSLSQAGSVHRSTTPEKTYRAASPGHALLPEVPVKLAEDLRLDWVPHATSLFMDAIASHHQETILHVARLYRKQDVSCVLWEYDAGFDLWKLYTPEQQALLQESTSNGVTHVQLRSDDEELVVNLRERHQTRSTSNAPHTPHRSGQLSAIRRRMRAILQYRDRAKDEYAVTSNVDAVPAWEGCVLVFAPTHAAAAAADSETTLALLLKERIADHSLWAPPCLAGTHVEMQRTTQQDRYLETLSAQITSALGDDSWQRGGHSGQRRQSTAVVINERNMRGETDSGIGNRLTDGLQAPQDNAEVAFYAPDYVSTTWTLPFCSRLPRNPIGYSFSMDAILKMTEDALMKVHELQRQQSPHSPRYAVAIFVYTYELFSEEEQDQIYAAMNRAMRLRDEKALAYWRPLVWELDQALQSLPSYAGKSYRGINCVMDPKAYHTGRRICWPSFSSASKSRGVAEEFAKGDAGTLFFLQSTSAKWISSVSRFPDEEEVLFAPNSIFEITSTMTQASDIGQFYGKIDNIAMKQCGGLSVPGLKPRPVGHTSMLVHLPPAMYPAVLDSLAQVQSGGVQSVDLIEEREDGISAYVVIEEDPSSPYAPFDAEKLMSQLALGRLDELPLPDPVRVTTPVSVTPTTGHRGAARSYLSFPAPTLLGLDSPPELDGMAVATALSQLLPPPKKPKPKKKAPAELSI